MLDIVGVLVGVSVTVGVNVLVGTNGSSTQHGWSTVSPVKGVIPDNTSEDKILTFSSSPKGKSTIP